MAGETTRAAIAAQPDWLRQVPTDQRLPDGARVVYTGCGTSFHAAQTGGEAVQALEAVLRPPEADLLVVVSHEGDTPLTLEAARAFPGPKWLVTGEAGQPARRARRRGDRRDARDRAELVPHRELHVRGRGAGGAPRRGRSTGCPTPSPRRSTSREPRVASTSAGSSPAPAATGRPRRRPSLKLREGVYVAAEAHETEQLLHGHLAAVDESVRCFVLEGEGRAAERAAGAVAALRELGCDVTLVPTRHPVVDIVRFQLLTLELAEARGVESRPHPARRRALGARRRATTTTC